MKLSKAARMKLRMASITEVKKVRAATKTLFEFNLIGLKRVEMIWRNLGKGRPAWMKK